MSTFNRSTPQPLYDDEQVEIDYWEKSPTECPLSESIENLINKFGDAGVLLERLAMHRLLFQRAVTIVELGAGQGWASCVVKGQYPDARVIATDISRHAVASAPKWERVLQVTLDHTAACRSYELPFANESIDLIFAFQAAHHFRAHRRTFAEVSRVLRPGGACVYLHEPTCRAYIYPLAFRRVNRKRPHVPEDVIVFDHMLELARKVGLRGRFVHDLSLAKRGPVEMFYYWVLRRVPFLKDVLPATKDFIFVKE